MCTGAGITGRPSTSPTPRSASGWPSSCSTSCATRTRSPRRRTCRRPRRPRGTSAMFPRLFTLPAFDLLGREIGPLTLHSYGVLLALAFLAGLWAAGWQARKAGMSAAAIADMSVYVLIAGLVGAKVLLLVIEWGHYSRNPRELFSLVQSGGVFYGGLIGALPVAWWYARRHSLSGWQTADVLAPAVAIGQSVGRIGCLAAGCCYGRAAEVPW